MRLTKSCLVLVYAAAMCVVATAPAAAQSGESPRRVRAQLEKRGLMDVLRNQIIERKVLELVQSEAKFKDEPYEPQKADTEAISIAAGGGTGSAIPVITEAKEEKEE